jgi:uncharacterized protein
MATRSSDMTDRRPLPGKFVWFELVTGEATKAEAFYGEVLGWTARPFPMGADTYRMIYAGDDMIGGYAAPADGRASHWIAYISIEDVDACAAAAAASGGAVVEPPSDIPGVGRRARIRDPQGAELCLLASASGDRPDAPAPAGHFFWNELHTTDPAKALSFYQEVIGFSHSAIGSGADAYHVLSLGGVRRGGVTGHLPGGAAPHWLPYVAVDDPDAVIARARAMGAAIQVGPEDIPGIGRFGVLEDPTGAVLAIMRPLPQTKQA